MEIVFHSHHATISDRLRARAESSVRKLGKRLPGVVSATIRFENDGPVRTVELVLLAAGRRQLFAKASGRYWGPAIADAHKQLEQQVTSMKRTRKEQGRKGVSERRAISA
ncbi:MAG: HPF/RaiA family ribosome-associated protein [Gemmatimonadaceae bacterium]|nr:HPF/RaiA family ribosome-associated protein [Gemmatimonadaceae bacterium]